MNKKVKLNKYTIRNRADKYILIEFSDLIGFMI